MRISTKGRYALRVMIDLAQHDKDEYVKLQELAEKEGLSEKYLEGILGALVRGKLLAGARGKAGGYKLDCDPAECSVWQILSLVETSVAPVACLDDEKNSCDRADICATLPVWKELSFLIKNYLDSVKLDQFLRNIPKNKGKVPAGKSWNCGL